MASGAPAVAAIEEAPDAVDKENDIKTAVEDKAAPKAPTAAAGGRSSKKDTKEGKKSGAGSDDGSMMDIGVWNPDAVKGNPNQSIHSISIS